MTVGETASCRSEPYRSGTLQKGREQPADDGRHFGLVVDNKETTRRAPQSAEVKD